MKTTIQRKVTKNHIFCATSHVRVISKMLKKIVRSDGIKIEHFGLYARCDVWLWISSSSPVDAQNLFPLGIISL